MPDPKAKAAAPGADQAADPQTSAQDKQALDFVKSRGYSDEAAKGILKQYGAETILKSRDEDLGPAEQSTPAAVSESGPSADDLDAVAAEEAAKVATSAPASMPNTTSHVEGVKGGPTNPSIDSDKFDSLGNEKLDPGPVGPRGKNMPNDVMTDADRQAVADKQEKRLRQGMSSTDAIDSRGEPQGHFAVTPQGHDKHGARIPDKVDKSEIVEPPPLMVGPRGKGAPPDTFHGSRPAKR